MSESRFLGKCLSKNWHERVGGIWFTTDMNGIRIRFYVTFRDGYRGDRNLEYCKMWFHDFRESFGIYT